jgi:hypothetical protein
MTDPRSVVQRQLEAYNRRDLEAFAALFADNVEVWRMPAGTPALAGREALRAFYATQRFNRPALHAEIVHRHVFGNKVFDHERIHGLADAPLEMMAVYEVADGHIERVWFYAPG